MSQAEVSQPPRRHVYTIGPGLVRVPGKGYCAKRPGGKLAVVIAEAALEGCEVVVREDEADPDRVEKSEGPGDER